MSKTQNKCWICGSQADSSEHKFKKADLVRAHGKGPYNGENSILYVNGKSEKLIQGPNSDVLKYLNSLCSKCNNHASQPWDRAYDLFISWVIDNESELLRKRYIDFKSVFCDNFDSGLLGLYKYYAKSFGCQLNEQGFIPPRDFVELFSKNNSRAVLKINFSVNEVVLTWPKEDQDRFIGQEGLVALLDRENPQQLNGFYSTRHYSWLTANLRYSYNSEAEKCSNWLENNELVFLY